MHFACSALSFLFVLICQVADDANLQTSCLLRALPVGVSRYAPAESTTAGHPRIGLACSGKMSHRHHGSARLTLAVSWLGPSVPLAHGHRCTT